MNFRPVCWIEDEYMWNEVFGAEDCPKSNNPYYYFQIDNCGITMGQEQYQVTFMLKTVAYGYNASNKTMLKVSYNSYLIRIIKFVFKEIEQEKQLYLEGKIRRIYTPPNIQRHEDFRIINLQEEISNTFSSVDEYSPEGLVK